MLLMIANSLLRMRDKGFYANSSRNRKSPDRKTLRKNVKNCARDVEV